MPKHHVIIGAGPTATSALETIRQLDQGESRITLICDEPAHSRMALPYWLAGQIPREHTLTADDAYYRKLNVEARIGIRVENVHPESRHLTLSDGGTLAFDDLLIATGSSAVGLPVSGADLPGVQPLWTLAHTDSILAAVERLDRPRVALVGAGFIGCIVLNAMYKRAWRLTIIERDSQLLPRMLDADAAGVVERWLAAKGIEVHTGASVQSIAEGHDGAKRLALDSGIGVEADLVIVATGVRSNLDCVQNTGIETDQGILVNDRLQTSFPFIYAGGDVAQGPVLFSDTRTVHAIQPTAIDHGRVAGANMAGQDVRYPGSLSMNVLEVCGLHSVSFGNWSDSDAEAMTIADRDIYRRLLWTGDQITGAIFTGCANDVGMLTDVGMVKGIMQTRTPLGLWKPFLAENPFDIRRPYVATRVAEKLVATTLLGRPSRSRQFQYEGASPQPATGPAHAVFVSPRRT